MSTMKPFFTIETGEMPTLFSSRYFRMKYEWFRALAALPVAIIGIQTWDDAKFCIVTRRTPLSLQSQRTATKWSPSALETLLEIRSHCLEVLEKDSEAGSGDGDSAAGD
jgi:L-lactate dehydrogenase (cytochrome)